MTSCLNFCKKKYKNITAFSVFLGNFAAKFNETGLPARFINQKSTKFYAEKIVLSGVYAVDALVDGNGTNHDIKHGW